MPTANLLSSVVLSWRQVATEGSNLDSYFCSVLRLMPLAGIDPSLALGFYCRTLGAPSHACLPHGPTSQAVAQEEGHSDPACSASSQGNMQDTLCCIVMIGKSWHSDQLALVPCS